MTPQQTEEIPCNAYPVEVTGGLCVKSPLINIRKPNEMITNNNSFQWKFTQQLQKLHPALKNVVGHIDLPNDQFKAVLQSLRQGNLHIAGDGSVKQQRGSYA